MKSCCRMLFVLAAALSVLTWEAGGLFRPAIGMERSESEAAAAPELAGDRPLPRHQEFIPQGTQPDPGPPVLRRLTVGEYLETVRSTLGVELGDVAPTILPRDVRADGFSNTAYNLHVDLAHVEAYARLAEIAVRRISLAEFLSEFARSTEATEDNLRLVIAGMGKWILRGPLHEEEVSFYLTIAQEVLAQEGDFHESLGYVVEAMLQSPRFLYLLEDHTGDGSPRQVSDYELASRMSYILWGGPPDRELMRAADAGELSRREGVARQVQRMLDDPRAIDRSLQFIHDWLDLGRLQNLRPNRHRFPGWDSQLARDMREETLAFFRDLAWDQRRPLNELINAQFTYLTPRLAAHYGLDWNHSEAGQASRQRRERGRSSDGLQVLYTFREGAGDSVRDVSGSDSPIDLKISDPSAVRWTDSGLVIDSPTVIVSDGPPTRLIDAIRATGAFSIEAWITPAERQQTGPARILTLSSGPSARNFTLGQDGDRYDVRFRTPRTDGNGNPSVSSSGGSANLQPTHVVYTRDAPGRAMVFINGHQQGAREVNGDLSNWESGFLLAVGNEVTLDRPWRGTLHLLAIYNRALDKEEIETSGVGLSRYDLSTVPARGGLLTHGSLLTIGGDDASMVTRGLFVLQNLLASGVDDPPPGIDTTPVPTEPGLSHREIAEQRMADFSCMGCHARFEPLAFGLEKFDGIGAYHEQDEHGNQLRDDGEILFPNHDEPIPYENSSQLMDLLADSDRVRECLTLKLTQFALGRPLVESDTTALKEIHLSAWQAGGTYSDLITAIVLSDLVRMTRTEAAP